MNRLINHPAIGQALAFLEQDDPRVLEQTLELCQIPAPSHHEEARSNWVASQFRQAGLSHVTIDEVDNVLGSYGSGSPKIMIAAHLDTVFPVETDLTVHKEGNRYFCPGINDDTRAVAELLSIARAMTTCQIPLMGTVIFCANVCEEGLGDLKGVKHIFRDPKAVDAFLTVDNGVPGCIICKATGSLRYEVTFRGSGGHSFSDFGIPNPIHAMGRALAVISQFQVPQFPKTTFNVGIVKGGTSVNTIAQQATMLVDLRSDSKEELDRLSRELYRVVEEAVLEENNRWDHGQPVCADIRPCGNRPAGSQPEDAPIVQLARQAALAVGLEPEIREESSTDANLPISLGIPALALGRGGKEGGIHTLQEWYEPDHSWKGPQRDLLLLAALCGVEETVSPASLE